MLNKACICEHLVTRHFLISIMGVYKGRYLGSHGLAEIAIIGIKRKCISRLRRGSRLKIHVPVHHSCRHTR